ncbi:MAG: hypothetical protein AAF806_32395 [Bacteroidota bacterium]
MFVKDELSYDRFHENLDRIYRSFWDAQYGWIILLMRYKFNGGFLL